MPSARPPVVTTLNITEPTKSCVVIISMIYLEYGFGGFGMPPANGSPGKEVWR